MLNLIIATKTKSTLLRNPLLNLCFLRMCYIHYKECVIYTTVLTATIQVRVYQLTTVIWNGIMELYSNG